MDKSSVGMKEGAVIWRCSVNKVFWKTAQNSQGNTCAESHFNEVSDLAKK